MNKTKKTKQRGFSLLELLVSMSILLMIIAMACSFLFSSAQSSDLLTIEARIKSGSEQGLNRLSRSLAQTRRLYGQPNTGNHPLLGKLQIDPTYRVIPSSKLPTIRDTGSLSPEKSCEISSSSFFASNTVGNSLLFLELIGSYSYAGLSSASLEPRKIDIYRLNYIYISDRITSGTQSLNPIIRPSKLPAQNLIQWSSVPIADYQQLKGYTDAFPTQKGTIMSMIMSSGYRGGVAYAADLETNDFSKFFYQLSNGGDITLQPNSFTLPMSLTTNALRLNNEQNVTYSIAYNQNNNPSSVDYFPVKNRVPFLYSAQLNPPCASVSPQPTATPNGNYAFPRGFEVMIVGPSSGRSVLLRSTVVGKGNHPKLISQSHMFTTYVRDL